MTTELCRFCQRGTRIQHSYEYAGVKHDDSYCNRCGRRWPAPLPPPPPEDVPLPDDDD